jgi:hypothetical protein
MRKWWPKIATSKKIEQNKQELENYRNSLNPGDVALLGTLTEGGVGLQTGNNGKYIGVKQNTKQAEAIKNSRFKKLQQANEKIGNPEFNKVQFLSHKSEYEIRELFDELKIKYGRDIFGRGYIFRIIEEKEIADVNEITNKERKEGIEKNKPHFVPYDKGDKGGNRFWLETPFVIDWSQEIVRFFKENSGKKGIGMPVFRNPQFYFREGFCWSDIHTVLIKSRLKSSGVYDISSMSMFSQYNNLPNWFFVSVLNSTFISEYDFNFINGTSHFQINDARQIPIVIPSAKQICDFKNIFDQAYKIKQDEFAKKIDKENAAKKLINIQKGLDELVMNLYELTDEEKEIIRKS